MENNMYEVIALIPMSSDFSLEKAVSHFESLFFRNMRLGSEFAKVANDNSIEGFRVRYGNWSIVAWTDKSPGVLADNQHLLADVPLPTHLEITGHFTRRLYIYLRMKIQD